MKFIESETLELKKSTSEIKEAIISIVSILNKNQHGEFSEVGTKFITTFKRKSYYESKGGVEDITQKTTQKGLAEGLVERLAESQKIILKLIKENPYISKKELSKTIGISTTAIDKNITRLKKKGVLKRIGPDKGGYWKVVKK